MMNYKTLLFTISLMIFLNLSAQNNVGIGTLTPNNNAILDLQSIDQGLLVPRLTTAQRIGLVGLGNTEKALLVFDVDLNRFFYWNGIQWIGFPLDNDITNELQDLTLQNDSILISNGTGVDLSGLIGGGTDNQSLSWNNDSILISNGVGMDASILLDNTDEQNLTLSNDTIYIQNGNWIYKPDNVNDADADVTNELQDLTLQNDSILISNGTGVDLSGLIGSGTDNQSLSWNNDSILISNGVGMDASILLDNTDEQNLTLSNDTIYIQNGNWIYKPDNVNDADADVTNELQDLTLQNDSILISNGTGVDLSGLIGGGTDNQNLTGATLNASNILTINIENGNSTTVDLSSLAGSSSTSDNDWYEYGTTNTPSSISNNLYTNGNTSIGLNTENRASLNVKRSLLVTNTNSVNNITTSNFKGIFATENSSFGTGNYSLIIGQKDTTSTSNDGYAIFGNKNKISGIADVVAIFGENNKLSGISSSKIVFGDDNKVQSNGIGFSFTAGENITDLSNGTNFVFGNNHHIQSNGGNVFIIGENDTTTSNSSGSFMIGQFLKQSGSSANSFSFGHYCHSNRVGAFLIGDSNGDVLTPNASNSMSMRFRGGYRLFSNNTLTSGVSLAAGGGAWSNISDKNKKENFEDIDKQDILNKISGFKIYNWNYISQEDDIRHIGPFAQDFYKAFQLGTSNKSIVTSDISGVNMVAIQALNENNKQLTKQVEMLQSENEEIKLQLQLLERKIELLLNTK